MAVKIDIDAQKLAAKLDRTIKNGMGMLASQILKDCNLYCKEDTGMLIASSFIHSDLNKGLLVWRTPYAARQYYEIRTAYKDVNHNATWRWCEYAKQRHMSEWGRMAQAITRLYR